jgi:hypothetical protein
MAEQIIPPGTGDLAKTHGGLEPPGSPGSELMRDVLALGAKALLSTIPFAVLVFDIGEKAIKFANDKDTRRYLLGLAEMIGALRAQVTDIDHRLQHDRYYQDMAQHALQRIGNGIDDAFVADLINASLNISLFDVGELRRREIAHAIRQLRPIHIALLRAIDRFWRKDMGDYEIRAAGPKDQRVEPGHQLAAWLEHSVPGFEQEYVISELQALHLLENVIDGGVLDEKPYVTAAELTPFGREVLGVLALPPGISKGNAAASST